MIQDTFEHMRQEMLADCMFVLNLDCSGNKQAVLVTLDGSTVKVCLSTAYYGGSSQGFREVGTTESRATWAYGTSAVHQNNLDGDRAPYAQATHHFTALSGSDQPKGA